jgi:RNA-directed DNA polymerase
VEAALKHGLEPIFERDFATSSYGFRPGRGCREAVGQVEQLLKEGYIWCVDGDLKSYFDTIPHERLMARIKELISDGRLLGLFEKYLKAGVMDGLQGWEPTEQGTPQGAVISPLLSNIYLNPLDHLMAGMGYEMVRYADDFVVLCRTPADAAEALSVVKDWTASAGLSLHPTKTRLVDADTDGFDFLGYHFEPGQRWPRAKSLATFKDAVRAKTKRTTGRGLAMVIADLNPTLRGWFEYYKHSRRRTFGTLDGWIRRRLRSLLKPPSPRASLRRSAGGSTKKFPKGRFSQSPASTSGWPRSSTISVREGWGGGKCSRSGIGSWRRSRRFSASR